MLANGGRRRGFFYGPAYPQTRRTKKGKKSILCEKMTRTGGRTADESAVAGQEKKSSNLAWVEVRS